MDDHHLGYITKLESENKEKKSTGWKKGKKKLSTNSKGENLEMEVRKINK
jgi:hypothetical protein